ncbi:hypothetical protein Leryth_012998 [Lithospermum erythrorhizon]|nr:hypothetical protein Leryth_012998 [Lithospermum erythrorhizon]
MEEDGSERNLKISNFDRWKAYYALLGKTINEKLRRNGIKEVANMMSIPTQTIRRIWTIHKSTPKGEDVDVS